MATEAQKRAKNKWDAEHMANVVCKMRREIVEDFKATAKANGTTPSALIRGWIDAYMQQNKPAE